MGYFKELPDLLYQSPFSNRISSDSYIKSKNIFRRMKLRDDLQNVFTIFNKYIIKDGQRPDTIAESLYGNSELDWVVILSAGLVNLRNDWPLSSKELYDFTVKKYGLAKINDNHHYESKEIRDSLNKLILPKGKCIDSDFSITYYDNGTMVTPTSSKTISGVSNYEYEVLLNEKKRSIYILKIEYLQQFITDMKNEMIYKKSSQYVNDKLIKTENTRITIP